MRSEADGITLTDEITVRLIDKMGGDHMVVAAAKVSTTGEEALEFARIEAAEGNAGLIRFLMKHRHGVPFEHGALTIFVHAPAVVWWEWKRHRIGFSYSLESGRYKVLEPVFWVPHPDRKMVPAPGHKSSQPSFVLAEPERHARVVDRLKESHLAAWKAYQANLADGIANEVSRAALGFAIYYSGWVTCNPRSLMAFLSLRVNDPISMFPSFPQAEIEQAARVAESFLADGWPITHAAFVKNGRVGP